MFSAAAQVEMTHQSWRENTFGKMAEDVRSLRDLNILALPNARLVRGANQVSEPPYLIDGEIGVYGATGRVEIRNAPSTLVYYLGKPQTIQEIRLYSANIDNRSNQDFEIRLANNEKNPGKIPTFPDAPTFTSGDKILGPNVGGFLSRIAEKSGKPLFGEQKYDWIEFKIWRTYPTRVGDPAKAASKANSWASFVELQVLANPNDTDLFASEEERQNWLNARAAERFRKVLSESAGEDVVAAIDDPEPLRRAINDLSKKFPDQYDGKKYLTRYEDLTSKLKNALKTTEAEQTQYIALAKEFGALRKEALLANPLMNFDQLLFRRAKNAGLQANWISNAARGKGGYGNALALVNPQDAMGEAKTIIDEPNGSFVGDINLHWDADKMLVTALSENKTWQIFELGIDGSNFKQMTPSIGTDVDNVEGCYVPDGAVLFVSTANMMGVPCIDGSSPVGNIYRLETDGKTIRQLTFEQDQDWCPVLLPNGRVMYLRWKYIDTPHYFTRILFSMNPDGTNQVAHYGSNGYWPNSLFYARPIPGNAAKFAGIVSGHHGVARIGELALFDINKGRREAEGAVQKIPGFEKPVEPIIMDQLVDNSWPKFLFPAPLDDNYLIVSAQLTSTSPWCLYLVDTFDNMLKLREEPGYGLFEPTPVIKQPMPPVQVNRVKPESKESTVFVTDVYFGQALPDVPKGTVKKLRVFELNYGYRGIGSHNYFGVESCWDARRILGEVPVYEDGSTSFKIPANTPLAMQPLDEQGRAVQQMRSWFVGMPGESQSCAGCHEHANTVSPNRPTEAMRRAPAKIEPFFEAARPFSFPREVQPVLDRYCAGCHDGAEDRKDRPNFADTKPGPGGFSQSYHALHRYVRRPGPEGDYYVLKPMEFHASSSELFIMLEKGHHGVEIDSNSMRRLHAWADLNVPYFGTWLEISQRLNRPNVVGVADRASELRALYAGVDFNPENEPYAHLKPLEKVEFLMPKEVKLDYSVPNAPNWTFDAAEAKKKQTKPNQKVSVGDSSIELAFIPAGTFVMGDDGGFADELPRPVTEIKKPFWMMTTEVTNALYKQFDPEHDSRYIDQWHKDHTLPGYPANLPDQPVIRINQQKAAAFCQWLSEKTGKKFRLPTEAEWEWACRAGTATPMWYGNTDADFGKLENMSDMQTKKFVVNGVNPQPINNPAPHQAFIPRAEGVDDGNMIAQKVGAYQANPWGLFDMHGSVSEWTSSDYVPYSANRESGTVSPESSLRKVVRGGSWRDRPEWSRSGIRRAYEAWQPVYNVGLRVVCESE